MIVSERKTQVEYAYEDMIDDIKTVLDTQKRLVSKRRKHQATGDPREELKKLVKQHRALIRTSVSITHMASDRTNRETGETIPCNLPLDIQEQLKGVAQEAVKKRATHLETAMLQQLRQVPIYDRFLKHVFGVGPVVAAYLVSEIDIHRSVKSSALRRFCGLAVINGRLERRAKGVKSSFSSELRTRLYQMFSSMWKNGRGKGRTCKYLEVWTNSKHRKLQTAVDDKVNNGVKEVSAQGYAHSYGWHKAADVFIEDLYMVWRALEGLPVWPSYYAAKLGYEHGGKISVNAPKTLTVEEALAVVGEVGGRECKWDDRLGENSSSGK